KNLGGAFTDAGAALPQDAALKERFLTLADRVGAHYDRFAYHFALNELFESIYQANRYLDDTKPWTLAKAGKTAEVAGSLRNAAEALRIIALLLSPVMP